MNQNPKNQYLRNSVLGIVCVLVVVILAWGDNPGFRQLRFPGAENAFYNLLIQGFNAGHLNVITPAPANLTQLANPYDLTANGKLPGQIWDMSYYKGKLYLYFGVAPAIVLYWPYNFVTGGYYLPDQAAVFIFLSTGFLAMAFLLNSIWKQYFENVAFWVLAISIFSGGLALATLEAQWWWSDVYEVAQCSGFAFAMLTLVAVWQAMHQMKRKMLWLLLANLTYGLAIASRPSLLFGAIILLIPLIYEWRNLGKLAEVRKMVPLLLATICPIVVIGAALMIYNFLRFENAFEFGLNYLLGARPSGSAFNWRFFWFNFYYYFLEPMRWTNYFPFVQTFDQPAAPMGHLGANKASGGILFLNYPFALAALAIPLAWRRKDVDSGPLQLFTVSLSVLFISSALVICLLWCSEPRYQLDFMPAIWILSVVGIFNLERQISGQWRRIARFAWCLLLADTLAFNVLAIVEGHVLADYFSGNFLILHNQPSEALNYLKNAVALSPGGAMYHTQLSVAYSKIGDTEGALAEAKKAVTIDPNSSKAQYNMGSLLYQSGQTDEAFKYFGSALNSDPHHTNVFYAGDNVNNAWLIVSNPDPAKRNKQLAIKLAEAACQETDYKDANALAVSAAVFGESGQFDEAISLAQKATVVAEQKGDSNILNTATALLARYQKKQTLLPPDQGAAHNK